MREGPFRRRADSSPHSSASRGSVRSKRSLDFSEASSAAHLAPRGMPSSTEGRDLLQSLFDAEVKLADAGSASSKAGCPTEERDKAHLTQKAEEELAIRTSSSTSSSSASPHSGGSPHQHSGSEKSMPQASSSAHMSGMDRESRESTSGESSTSVDRLQKELSKSLLLNEDLMRRLGATLEAGALQAVDIKQKSQDIARLERVDSRSTAKIESQKMQLVALQAANDALVTDLADANDSMAGLRARHEANIIQAVQKHEAVAQQASEVQKSQATTFEEEHEAFQALLRKAAAREKRDGDEWDKLQLFVQTMQKDHKAQVKSLSDMLDSSNRALALNRGSQPDLRGKLAESEKQLRSTADELSNAKLELLQQSRTNSNAAASSGDGVGNWPRGGRGRSGGRGRGALQRGPGKSLGSHLTSIDEGSQDGSQASSSHVSGAAGSDPGDDVGDLADFDDSRPSDPAAASRNTATPKLEQRLESLETQMQEEQQVNDLLKVQAAETDAQHHSKVSRLEKNLLMSQQALKDNLEKHAGEVAKNDRRMEALQTKLDAANIEVQWLQEREQLETLRVQLACALEGKRLAEGRADQLNQAMAAMELELADLRHSTGSAGQVDAGRHATEDLQGQLVFAVQQRNVLQNELECKAVQFENQLQDLERVHGTETHRLRQVLEDLQEAFWQVLCSVPQLLAFCCEHPGGRILKASPASTAAFGDDAREGHYLQQLEADGWQGCWLDDVSLLPNTHSPQLIRLGPDAESSAVAVRIPGERSRLMVVLHRLAASSP